MTTRRKHTMHWICLLALVLAVGQAHSQPRPGAGGGQSVADRQVQAQAGRQAERGRERAAERATERAQSRALERMPAMAAERLEAAVGSRRPVADLPSRVPIPDRSGGTVFVDIEISPNVRAIEREWVMLLDASQHRQLEDQAPDLMRFLVQTRPFEAMDGYLLKFRVPPDLDANNAIVDLVPEPLQNLIDRNHVYSPQSGSSKGIGELPLPMRAVCTDDLAIGVIDSAINVVHPAFAADGMSERFVQRDFLDENMVRPAGHGTAVAGLLVGQGPELVPLLPGATVYSASVAYSRDGSGDGVTVMHLLEALGWLTTESLSVINMSMSGPDNRLLAQGINIATARGKVVVAAAGNEGPHGPALYPAAYDGVLTATAVARDGSIYRWANQGKHVDFAALGVSVPTALADGSFGEQSGTSLAAPVVSAFLACALNANGNRLEAALAQLKQQVVDLGEPGHDPVYGHGLLHPFGDSAAP